MLLSPTTGAPRGTNLTPSRLQCFLPSYKLDMASALEHLANSMGIKTSYDDLTPDARAKRSAKANKARAKKRARDYKSETDGPPDKRRDFKKQGT